MHLIKKRCPANEQGDVMGLAAYDAEYLGIVESEERVPNTEYDAESRIYTCYATWDTEAAARAYVAAHS